MISPVRDEEEYIEGTIRSILSQTVRPDVWVIVNDGSTDKTQHIVRRYLSQNTEMRLVNLPDRGYRKTGAGVVEAFIKGYETVEARKFNFIVKLDGDITFEKDYFEKLFKEFDLNPKLGLAGGWVYDVIGDKVKPQRYPPDHVRGAVKVYRRQCFQEIGGLIPTLGWDGIDEMSAQMKGWETRSFKELRVFLHKPMGSTGGILRGRLRGAYGACKLGYNSLFMTGRCLRKMLLDKPLVTGGLMMLMGFYYYKLKGVRPLDNPELIKYIRDKQRRRMILWKKV